MKVSSILNIVLAIALVVMCAKYVANGNKQGDSGSEDAVLENIATRTSIRAYEDKPVEKEKIRQLLKAGMAAPTAKNKQPWHFIVVTDKNLLRSIGERCHNAEMAEKAPLAIVVCGDMNKTAEGTTREMWVQDASAATENILLAAHAMGLGAVWTGTYPYPDRVKAYKEILKLPEHIVPFCGIIIGYAAENPAPKDKFKEENISYNFFGNGQTETTATPAPKEEGGFKEFDIVSQFGGNPFNYFTGDGLLLCTGNRKASNAMTIGWGGLGTLWQRPALSVYVRQNRFTHHLMETSPYFTVMSFKNKSILKYMGTHSGRNGDKAKHLGLHTLYTKNGTPYYQEADMVIECRTMYGTLLPVKGFREAGPRKFYEGKETAPHTMYVGEVIGAMKK